MHLRAPIVEITRISRPVTPSATKRRFGSSAPTRIATLAVGYADGYPRSLSESGSVLDRRTRSRRRRTVTMDMTMIDVTTVAVRSRRRCDADRQRRRDTVLTVERVADDGEDVSRTSC